jgi:hypothetical protein
MRQRPNGARQSKFFSKMSPPTDSRMRSTPRPPVFFYLLRPVVSFIVQFGK